MMEITKINVRFEIKSMGISFFLPIVGLLFLLFFNYTDLGPEFVRKLSLYIEFIICPMAAWWCSYLFLDYYEEDLEEILFTYPVSMLFHGILRVFVFLSLYLLGFFIVMVPISLTHETMLLKTQVIQYFPQCILYAAIGFLLMVTFKNIIVPILTITGYIAVKYFTGGSELFPIYNIMAFEFGNSSQYLPDKFLPNIMLAILFFVLGHVILLKRNKV
jgi:hypothetical protein